MLGSIVASPVPPPNQPKGRWFFAGAIAISLIMHAVAGFVLIDGVERQLPETEENPVMVDLVPPPERETPDREIPEPTAPEPEVQEPPPQPQEQAEPQEQPKPEEQVAEAPPNVPVLQPVIEFGETDSGPRVDLEGVSERELDKQEPERPEPEANEAVEKQDADPEASEIVREEVVETSGDQEGGLTETPRPERTEAAANTADEEQDADPAPSDSVRQEPVVASNEQAPGRPEATEPDPEPGPEPEPDKIADDGAAAGDSGTPAPVAVLVTPKPRPARKPGAAARNPGAAARKNTGTPGGMTRATRLFSRETLNDPRVRTSMMGIPRSDRVNILCMTEMRGQLGAARPPRPPEYLPSFRLPRGNVLQPRQAAFRSRGEWYNFTFRCEVDNAATKVMTFSYRIGDAIPRVDWARRGLPGF